jgi:hypothetical protein
MKKLLIVTAIGMLLTATTGCRFMECLWRGGPPRQQAQPVMCQPACAPSYSPCDGGATVTTTTMPGPVQSAAPGTTQ